MQTENKIEYPNCINKDCPFYEKMFIENCSKGVWVYKCPAYIEDKFYPLILIKEK